MSESPRERFRRIIKAAREEKEREQRPAEASGPAIPGRDIQATDRTTDTSAQRLALSTRPRYQRSDKPGESIPKGISQTVQSTPWLRPSETPQATRPSTNFAEMPKGTQPGIASGQVPGTTRQTAPPSASAQIPPLDPGPDLSKLRTPADARHFLERLRGKTAQVVQDFAEGSINQRQFQAVYSHYQRQRMAVEKALIEMPGSGAWRAAAVEGHTSFLRQQHAAQVISYAIYETASGTRVTQVGELDIDAAAMEPVLSRFRSSTQDLFGAGMTQAETKGGRWLSCVPGRYTTLVVIFSTEPAPTQLEMIEDLHRDFEMVNKLSLSRGDLSQLALTFTHLWAFEKGPIDT